MMITISILYNKAKIQALSLVENHDLLEDRRAELRHTKPYPIEFKGAVKTVLRRPTFQWTGLDHWNVVNISQLPNFLELNP